MPSATECVNSTETSRKPAASSPAAGTITVSPTLTGCEGSGGSVSCHLSVSFGSVAGANHYTASVRGPDGVVHDLGTVSSPAGITVPFAGNGTYTVTINAWR